MQPHSFALQTGAQIKPACARKTMKSFSCKTHRRNGCGLTLLQNPGCLSLLRAQGRSILGFAGGPYSAAGESLRGRDLKKSTSIHTAVQRGTP